MIVGSLNLKSTAFPPRFAPAFAAAALLLLLLEAPAATACTSDTECAGAFNSTRSSASVARAPACKGGQCCSETGLSTACVVCGAPDGSCTACEAGFELLDDAWCGTPIVVAGNTTGQGSETTAVVVLVVGVTVSMLLTCGCALGLARDYRRQRRVRGGGNTDGATDVTPAADESAARERGGAPPGAPAPAPAEVLVCRGTYCPCYRDPCVLVSLVTYTLIFVVSMMSLPFAGFARLVFPQFAWIHMIFVGLPLILGIVFLLCVLAFVMSITRCRKRCRYLPGSVTEKCQRILLVCTYFSGIGFLGLALPLQFSAVFASTINGFMLRENSTAVYAVHIGTMVCSAVVILTLVGMERWACNFCCCRNLEERKEVGGRRDDTIIVLGKNNKTGAAAASGQDVQLV
jgi:hypothetical protein